MQIFLSTSARRSKLSFVSKGTPFDYNACATNLHPFPRTSKRLCFPVWMFSQLTFVRQMRACQVFIPAVVALGLIVSPVFCQNVNSSEIGTQLNGSAADFGAYKKQFHRTYEVSSEEFSRRHLSFQVCKVREA